MFNVNLMSLCPRISITTRAATPCASRKLAHECASRWLEDGLDVREIQLLLGHANLEITQRYLNITDVGVVRSMRDLWTGGGQPGALTGERWPCSRRRFE